MVWFTESTEDQAIFFKIKCTNFCIWHRDGCLIKQARRFAARQAPATNERTNDKTATPSEAKASSLNRLAIAFVFSLGGVMRLFIVSFTFLLNVWQLLHYDGLWRFQLSRFISERLYKLFLIRPLHFAKKCPWLSECKNIFSSPLAAFSCLLYRGCFIPNIRIWLNFSPAPYLLQKSVLG